MNKDTLEFLFIGPLFSLFRTLNDLRRDLMALQDTINDYAARVDGYATKVGESNSRIEAAVAAVKQEIEDLKATPVGEPSDFAPVDAALSHLDTVVSDAGTAATDVEGLEPPVVPPAGTEEVPQ